jgi:hypothetical protein
MSGAIIFWSGGPVSWKSVRQEKTSLSSCEAEIRATNEASKLTVALRNLVSDLAARGYPISDAASTTTVFNDNEACVKWSHNMTTKQTRHMEQRENSVREWVQERTIAVRHVSGKCNPADLFTKEMKDGAHFRRLRDSFMCRAAVFLRGPQSVAGVPAGPQLVPEGIQPTLPAAQSVGTLPCGRFSASSALLDVSDSSLGILSFKWWPPRFLGGFAFFVSDGRLISLVFGFCLFRALPWGVLLCEARFWKLVTLAAYRLLDDHYAVGCTSDLVLV